MKAYEITWMDNKDTIRTDTIRAANVINLRKQIFRRYQKRTISYDMDMTVMHNDKEVARCNYATFGGTRYKDGTMHYPVWWIVGHVRYYINDNGSISRA